MLSLYTIIPQPVVIDKTSKLLIAHWTECQILISSQVKSPIPLENGGWTVSSLSWKMVRNWVWDILSFNIIKFPLAGTTTN